MPLICTGKTDIGQVRKSNQDAIFLNPQKKFFVLADGMGGHNGGEVASALAVKHVPEYFFANLTDNPAATAVHSIHYANQIILDKSTESELLKGMGTTSVLMFFSGNIVYLANVGDSRAYLINSGQIYQLTRDHSLVQEKLNLGFYTREEAIRDRMKNVLVRTVGYEKTVAVDVFAYKISRYDIFFLCSDGLHGKVSDSDLVFLANKYFPTPQQITPEAMDNLVTMMIAQANTNGGQDNISLIMVAAV